MAITQKSRRNKEKKVSHPAIPVEQGPPAVKSFREELGLSRKQFARLTAVSERAIAAWENDRPIGPGNQKGLREAQRLCRALLKIIKPDYIGTWLDAPNDAFSGLKPLDLIERGEMDRLWRMIFEIESGALS